MLRDTAILLATAPLLTAALASAPRRVVASCADGSVIFATKWRDVRCEGAIRVPAGHVPQVGSVWDRSAAESWRREATRERSLDAQITAVIQRGPGPRTAPAPALTLTPDAVRELKRGLAAGSAPAAAAIEHWRGVGAPDRMRLAHSPEIGRRIRAALRPRGVALAGPVLVFHLEPALTTPLVPAPAFAQGGVTFRPDPEDAGQLGWLAERRWGSAVGYVALPRGFDVARPMAIFWGDSVVATRPFPER